MRVLVCGGRKFGEDNEAEVALLNNVLNSFFRIDLIINGAAKGADSLSTKWAREHRVPCLMYPALWDKHGKAGGHIRNKKMLDQSEPDMVVAFPGGKGTANMIALASTKGVGVWDLSEKNEFNKQFVVPVNAENSKED